MPFNFEKQSFRYLSSRVYRFKISIIINSLLTQTDLAELSDVLYFYCIIILHCIRFHWNTGEIQCTSSRITLDNSTFLVYLKIVHDTQGRPWRTRSPTNWSTLTTDVWSFRIERPVISTATLSKSRTDYARTHARTHAHTHGVGAGRAGRKRKERGKIGFTPLGRTAVTTRMTTVARPRLLSPP